MSEEPSNKPAGGMQTSKEQQRRLAALRHPLEGVFNVFYFNWPKYILAGILSYTFIVLWMIQRDSTLKSLFLGLALLLFFWTLVSLLVSFVIYDLSGLYKYNWLLRAIKTAPANVLNLHAGFDESSQALQILFPNASLEVFDFYSGITVAEPSIEMARASSESKNRDSDSKEIEPVSVSLSGWNLPDGSQDLVMLFLSAHEVRKSEDREKFFSEIHRVLRNSGQCILVEHSRDAANFLVFGPGFLHFHPRGEWSRLAKKCGFELKEEKSITPFVKAFYLCKT
jgi:SAM-dependent methyltransferase